MTRFRRARRSSVGDETHDREAPAPAVESPQPRLADLTVVERGTEDQKSQQYSEWAERLKQKRQRAQQLAEEHDRATGAAPPPSDHWNPDAVFAESRRVEEAEAYDRPDPRRVAELLAVLDLTADATPMQVSDAYRRLAKRHHPDRFVTADADTQQQHAERMADINRAYRALKKIDRA